MASSSFKLLTTSQFDRTILVPHEGSRFNIGLPVGSSLSWPECNSYIQHIHNMMAINQVIFAATGFLGGACLIVAFAYFRESNNDSVENGFYRLISAFIGVVTFCLGIAFLTAPFAISSWEWFPDMLPKHDEADTSACLGGIGAAVVLFTCQWLFHRPRPPSRMMVMKAKWKLT